MKSKEDNSEIIHKNVIVIGNGPSGISLSYMLSGNIPYLISDAHPDELLSARLKPIVGKSLVHQNLQFLAEGLEGRSTNLVSLLLDALIHPCADMGLEKEPLIEWRPDGKKIDHLVLGKGPPGGAWHSMDPQILTLSLGSWMSLPGLPYTSRDGSEKRAFAGNVAKYYEEYVQKMNLQGYFKSNVCVTKVQPLKHNCFKNSADCVNSTTADEIMEVDSPDFDEYSSETEQKQSHRWVRRVKEDTPENRRLCLTPEASDNTRKVKLCPFSSALNFIGCGKKKKLKGDGCYFQCKPIAQSALVNCNVNVKDLETNISSNNYLKDDIEMCNSNSDDKWTSGLPRELNCYNMCDWQDLGNCRDSLNYNNFNVEVPPTTINILMNPYSNGLEGDESKWLVEVFDMKEQRYITYSCNNLVLANGASDIPNKLNLSSNKPEPDWFVYTVRNLEIALDKAFHGSYDNPDPVLVVGAGLSAADAVIAARGRNIPVFHVFKANSQGLNKQLPENMYPEYHKVHQMMIDGGSSYPLYTALPGYALTDFDASKRTVVLTSSSGESKSFNVSFAAILIGSRPDLNFLPKDFKLGVKKDSSVDCKTNMININQFTHAVNNYSGLYVMGPLVGDNFVRFIPGGALAILADLYRKYGY